MGDNLSIIIPAHNEEKRIGVTLEEYGKFFKEKKKSREIKDFEILVVLNACKDRTIDIVKKFVRQYKEIKYLDFEQGGKGFAITEGFRDALKREIEHIGFVDADLATKPEFFYDLVKNIKFYDGIIASRGLKSSIVKTSFMRKLTNKGFNFLVRSILFLPYKDTQCGAKLFRKEALSEVVDEIGITKWAYDIDLLYRLRKKGFRIREFPTVWQDREGSKLDLMKVPFQMFSSILRIRLLNSPFSFIMRAYDTLIPEKIKVYHR